MSRPGAFHWRSFTSFIITLAFVVITVSGLVLYVAPAGRVANWSGWRLSALDKAQWQAVHTIFAWLFVGFGILHLIFNWRVLLAHLWSKAKAGLHRRAEVVAAGVVTMLALVFTLAGWPPFSTIVALGESAKNSWAESRNEPPVPHAELLSLRGLADVTRQPLDDIVGRLTAAGLRDVTPQTTMADLAAREHRTPRELFALVAQAGFSNSGGGPIVEGGGHGRKTVAEIAAQYEVPLGDALSRLDAAGYDAKADATLRALAQQQPRTPVELVQLITGR
ncbi:MAG: DUF4405 domain-containing protein [Acidobacteria bacterium]|nr:DUF4405 domain-containing protein [Acidobacteriota bacterium]